MSISAPPPVRVSLEHEGRGRALIASRLIKPGEIILSDSPILLYPSSTTQSYCSHCFRALTTTTTTTRCPSCSTQTLFCSDLCRSKALSSSHTPWVCRVLSQTQSLNPKDQIFFLIAAYNLASTSPPDFQRLLSLHGHGDPSEKLVQDLHGLLASLDPPTTQFGFSVELTAALLAKDKMNSFGLMEPFWEGRERGVRAYGIYPNAAFFNHDCLPNACRFDYVDGDGERNVDIVVRAIHSVEEGREVCLSYFPVNWGYRERQKRLLEEYGFHCRCDRCEVEKNWKDEEDGNEDGDSMEEESGGEEELGRGEVEEENGGGGDEDFPHAYFFLRFLCNRTNCGGTLAPLPPTAEGMVSDQLECNVCGGLRKDEDDGEEDDGVMMDD